MEDQRQVAEIIARNLVGQVVVLPTTSHNDVVTTSLNTSTPPWWDTTTCTCAEDVSSLAELCEGCITLYFYTEVEA